MNKIHLTLKSKESSMSKTNTVYKPGQDPMLLQPLKIDYEPNFFIIKEGLKNVDFKKVNT